MTLASRKPAKNPATSSPSDKSESGISALASKGQKLISTKARFCRAKTSAATKRGREMSQVKKRMDQGL